MPKLSSHLDQMKLRFSVFLAAVVCLVTSLVAQERSRRGENLGEVETKWPGILLSISRIERIQDNRLLVFVRVTATTKSSPAGTFLGMGRPVPVGANLAEVPQEDLKPFSLLQRS
jgi:hypothetical protein